MKKIVKYKDYILLAGFTLFFCWLLVFRHGMFGANVDWISQHSVFPDYFRRLFYETRQLCPNFAMNIGGGQNIYNFAYYGLYNPVLMLSYLLPSVDMGTYLMCSSIVSLIGAVLLFYYWLMNQGFPGKISFAVSCIFLLAGPMIFHSYTQVMFVNYMPFLCIGLIGADRYFKERKKGLLILGTVLMIMTSFFFSVGGILVLIIYGIHRYVTMETDYTAKRFLTAGIRFMQPILAAVMLCGFLLLPSFLAIAGNRTAANKGRPGLAELFWPKAAVENLVYTPYGLGLTSLAVTVLIAGLFCKKWKQKILSIEILVVLLIPAFQYLLNGGLYVRGKALIPLLPLVLYQMAVYFCELQKDKSTTNKVKKLIPYILTLLIFFVSGIMRKKNQGYEKYLVIECTVMIICCLFYMWKQKLRVLYFTVLILQFSFAFLIQDSAKSTVKEKFYQAVTDKNIQKAVDKTARKDIGWYRMEQTGVLKENAADINRIQSIHQNITSFYSSVSNSDYMKFKTDSFGTEQPYRNNLMQSVSQNPLFQRFMGVKYLIKDYSSTDYRAYISSFGQKIYINQNAAPIAYVTDQLISEKTFSRQQFPYTQTVLMEDAVVKHVHNEDNVSKDVVEASLRVPEVKEQNAAITPTGTQCIQVDSKQSKKVTATLDQKPENKTYLFLQFDVKNQIPSKDVWIDFNGVRNKLSAAGHIYYNGNTRFTYTIDMRDLQKAQAGLVFGPGRYQIENLKCYMGNLDENKNADLYRQSFVVDQKHTKGDDLRGTVDVKRPGYFISSIPYDSHFTVRVDGKKIKYEKVNKAFIGMKMSEGNHTVTMKYHAAGVDMGRGLSLLGLLWILWGVWPKSRDRYSKRRNNL